MARLAFYVSLLTLLGIPAHAQQETGLPTEESEFCSVVNNATAAYTALSHQRSAAEEQHNGIRVQQIEQEMTSVYRIRNEKVFQLIARKEFELKGWVTTIVTINSPIENCDTNMLSCVFVDVHPLCSPITSIHAVTSATPAFLQFLSNKKRGDRLVVTGMFVDQWGGPTEAASPVLPTSPEHFEGSFTEAGSMRQPEYHVDVTRLQ
jgi:hypothetical protein